MEAGTIADLNAGWGTSGTDAYVAGNLGEGHVVLRYDGSAWSTVVTGEMWVSDLWGAAPDDVYLAGRGHPPLRRRELAQPPSPDEIQNRLNAVWGTSPSDFCFGGGPASWEVDKHHQLVRHYDGSAWTILHTTSEPGQVTGIWGTAAGDVFAVASVTTGDGGGRFHRGRRVR